MHINGFFLDDFEFVSDDGHTKTFTHNKTKVLFVKQWLDLVPNESIEFLDAGSERMYYDLNPNIMLKTIIDNKYVELPLVEYSLDEAKKLYSQIDKSKCAIIITGVSVLFKEDE